MNKKLTKLEAVRGFAALYVVLHHSFSKGFHIGKLDLSFLLKFGQEAVILFFILSGFVIQYAYQLSSDKSFKTFFIKRFFRIYIPLLIIFITNYCIASFEGGAWISVNAFELLANIFMLQDIAALKPNVISGPFLGNAPLWSLSYEWWFYMIFFVVVNKTNRPSRMVYVAGIIAALTYLIFPCFVNRELMYLVIWWVGADIARLYLDKQAINLKTLAEPLMATLVCVIILSGNYYLNSEKILRQLHLSHGGVGISPLLEVRHFAFALVAVLIALLWRKYNWLLFSKTIGFFEPLAGISFGIYISHWFLVSNASYLDFIQNYFVRMLLYCGICVFFAYVVERIIYIRINRIIVASFKKKKDG